MSDPARGDAPGPGPSSSTVPRKASGPADEIPAPDCAFLLTADSFPLVSIPLAAAIFDSRLRVVRASEHLARVVGIPAAECVGRTPSEVLPLVAAPLEAALRRVLETGETVLDAGLGAASGGGAPEWSVRAFPLPGPDGGVRGVLATLADGAGAHPAADAREACAVQDRGAELERAHVLLGEEADRRRLVEAELESQSEALSGILENIPVMLCIRDAGGQVSRVNPEFERVLGRGPGVTARAAETVFAALGSAASSPGAGPWRDLRLPGADGEGRSTAWAAFRISSGETVAIGIDLSERIRGEQERIRLAAAIEQTMESIVITDAGGAIVYANPAFEAVNGMTRAAAVGRTYHAVHASAAVPGDAATPPSLAGRDGRWSGRLRRRTPRGSIHDIDVVISPVRGLDGAIMSYLIVERDVSREVRLQDQVRQVQMMESLGTLAAGIAHDFNNILQAVTLNAEIGFFDAEPAGRLYESLSQILRAAGRGRDLVQQIITFSRQKERERERIRLTPVVREALRFLRASLPATVEIREALEAADDVVMADAVQIQQILVNLANNAAHAMRPAGGMLEVKLENITVRRGGETPGPEGVPRRWLRLSVRDTGGGMPPDVLSRIFDPFFTTKPPGEGTGMGLAVVHSIVKSHGGTIEVASEVGKGSVFRVFLPQVEGGTVEARPRPEAPPPARARGRVLLVEDEETLLRSFQMILERLGYQVVTARDGAEALEMFRLLPDGFDAVVTDQTMPRLTGFQLSEQIARLRPEMPIVLCTGFSETVDAAWARGSRARAFLSKPFTSREVAAVLERILAAPPGPPPAA